MTNGLKEREISTGAMGEILPSRAKYYYNTHENVSANAQARNASIRYDGFVLNRTASPEAILTDIKAPNEQLKQDIQKGNPDILPTGATLRMLNSNYKAPEKPFEENAQVSLRVNAKGKLIFAVYAIAVLSLILVIVLNAVAINRANQQGAELKERIATAQQDVGQKTLQLNSVINDSNAADLAAGYGMSQKEGQNLNIVVPVTQSTEYSASTNWFDRLCDLFN